MNGSMKLNTTAAKWQFIAPAMVVCVSCRHQITPACPDGSQG
jgi:hypothetical protein